MDAERDEAEYVELLWPIVPTGDVAGSLDWFTGVLALDVAHEVWRNPETAPRELVEAAHLTFSHEFFHFVQLTTMGFLHRWAARLYHLVLPAFERTKDPQGRVFGQSFAVLKAMIREGSTRLTADERHSLEQHFSVLDTPSACGLTIRAVFEGQAYFAERTANYQIQRPSDWTPHLKAAPDPIYRIAFDFLAFAADYSLAYEWFSLMAAVSLCSERPADSFERLAITLGQADAAQTIWRDLQSDGARLQFLQGLIPDAACASPLEWVAQPQALHPMLAKAVEKLADATNEKRFDPVSLFAHPGSGLLRLAESDVIEVPIIFRPAPPSKLAIQAVSGSDEGTTLALFTLGATCRQLVRAIAAESEEVGCKRIEEVSWLVRDHTPVMMDLALEDLVSGDPSRMVMIFAPKAETAEKLTTLWGRVVLRVPPELDPTQDALLPTVPQARRLAQALHRRLPMFPVYLLPQGNFYEWFGSLAPDEALIGTTVDVLHPDVQTVAREAERAIYASAAQAKKNPRLAVQRLLAPLYRALGDQ